MQSKSRKTTPIGHQNSLWMRRLSENKWSFAAAALLLLGLTSARGGLIVLGSLARFLIPLMLLLIVFNVLKKRLFGAASEAMRRQMEAMMNGMQPGPRPQGRENPGTITLCPKCGSYLQPGHSCRK